MRFVGLTVCLVLLIAGSGCLQAGLNAPAGDDKNATQGPETGGPVPGTPTGSGGTDGTSGVPPTGDVLPAFRPSANSNVQVAEVGSVVAKSESFTTLVTIDWTSGGVRSGSSTATVPLNLSVGQKKLIGGKP